MLATPPPPKFSVPVDDLKRWAIQRTEGQRLVDEANRKINAARELFGDLAVEAVIGKAVSETTVTDPNASVASVMLEVLKAKKLGVTPGELLEEMKLLPVGERIKKSTNNFYNSIGNLVNREEVVRHGKLLYAVETYGRVSGGVWVDPRFAEGGAPNKYQTAVLAVLRAEGSGMGAFTLVGRLMQNPDMAEKNRENPKYFHSLLSKMVKRGQIVRQGRLYQLPEWVNDTTKTEETNDLGI